MCFTNLYTSFLADLVLRLHTRTALDPSEQLETTSKPARWNGFDDWILEFRPRPSSPMFMLIWILFPVKASGADVCPGSGAQTFGNIWHGKRMRNSSSLPRTLPTTNTPMLRATALGADLGPFPFHVLPRSPLAPSDRHAQHARHYGPATTTTEMQCIGPTEPDIDPLLKASGSAKRTQWTFDQDSATIDFV